MTRYSLRNDKTHLNRIAIIASLEQRGMVCGVKDDGVGRFFVQVPKGATLTEWERAGVDVCRKGLREAWLLERGLCIRCGMDAAKRPNPSGRWCNGVTFNAETQRTEYAWGKCTSLIDTPRYCESCWVTQWQEWAREWADPSQNAAEGQINASSKKERAEDNATTAMQF